MKTPASPKRPAGPVRGHALVGTRGFLVLAVFLWLVTFAHTTGCLRVLKASQVRADDAAGATRAMAWALTLLETGRPPTNPSYSCLVSPDGNSDYVLTFLKTSGWQYTVSVRPAVSSDNTLPRAPSRFQR